jgi:hypothetical protein
MSVGFAKYKTKVFGDQLWTVENIRHYPSVAPIKDVYVENEGLKFYNWNAAMNTKTKAELPKAKAELQGICKPSNSALKSPSWSNVACSLPRYTLFLFCCAWLM